MKPASTLHSHPISHFWFSFSQPTTSTLWVAAHHHVWECYQNASRWRQKVPRDFVVLHITVTHAEDCHNHQRCEAIGYLLARCRQRKTYQGKPGSAGKHTGTRWLVITQRCRPLQSSVRGAGCMHNSVRHAAANCMQATADAEGLSLAGIMS